MQEKPTEKTDEEMADWLVKATKDYNDQTQAEEKSGRTLLQYLRDERAKHQELVNLHGFGNRGARPTATDAHSRAHEFGEQYRARHQPLVLADPYPLPLQQNFSWVRSSTIGGALQWHPIPFLMPFWVPLDQRRRRSPATKKKSKGSDRGYGWKDK